MNKRYPNACIIFRVHRNLKTFVSLYYDDNVIGTYIYYYIPVALSGLQIGSNLKRIRFAHVPIHSTPRMST